MEMKIIGYNACQMVFQKRPQDIAKIFLTEENVKKFSPTLKMCAAKKISYKVTTEEDLERVSGSLHHEGVCFYVKKKTIFSHEKFLLNMREKDKKTCVVALENVDNPHNIGAIIRVCANFGARAILLNKASTFQNPAVFRTAEGGAEWVELIDCKNLMDAVLDFRKNGFKIFTTSSHIGRPPHKVVFPDKTLLVFGSERFGLTQDLLKKGDAILSIPSTGHVESLNVSCAASIILNQYYTAVS